MTIAPAPSQPTTISTGGSSTATIVPALPGVGADELALAYAECRRITRARARNFYYGLRLTPEPRRSAIYSIYAWMRAADDEADAEAPLEERRARLRTYRERTRVVLGELSEGRSGEVARTLPPVWLAFGATAHTYPIDPSLFGLMLDGLEADLAHSGYATEEELSQYCYRVASTVGLACIAVWGLKPGINPGEARALAERRGQAFQRTNILRDFAQDFDGEPRRVYLPQSAFDKWGVSAEDVREWRDPQRCRGLMQEQAALARAEYDASAPLVGMIASDCAATLWAMTKIYSGLLELIEDDPARIVAPKRIRLPASRKALIALRATMRSKTSGW